jgi:chromate transporter
VAIFSPPALLMVLASQVLEHIRGSRAIQAALRGIRAAVLGLIAAAVVVGRGAEIHWISLLIFVGALLALIRFKVDVIWIIPAAGLLGAVLY